ncbi:unnamed protein product [Microthlaspi erraticum]|uniref:Uncharacterized protein n=1 Tax=Microthlaspi erraticum TaxID=1685480 RepID=A0A6D2L7E1_9BRAS|nr:unnamed protein product [Microthlaspi erraticum]
MRMSATVLRGGDSGANVDDGGFSPEWLSNGTPICKSPRWRKKEPAMEEEKKEEEEEEEEEEANNDSQLKVMKMMVVTGLSLYFHNMLITLA